MRAGLSASIYFYWKQLASEKLENEALRGCPPVAKSAAGYGEAA